MRRYALFVVIGLAYAFVPELTNLVLVNQQVRTFVGAQLAYLVILTAFYAAHGRLPPDTRPIVNTVAYMLFAALLGVFLEWNFAGQSPSQNPNANPWTMFVYWVGLAMIPRLLIDRDPVTRSPRRHVAKWWIAYWAVHLALSLALPRAVLPVAAPILWTVAGTASLLAYFRCIRLHRRDAVHARGTMSIQ